MSNKDVEKRLKRLEKVVKKLCDVVENLLAEEYREEATVEPFILGEIEDVGGKIMKRKKLEEIEDEWRRSYIIH